MDELDSSIHFKLTRAIVAMFNNELNTNAQMIFTVHEMGRLTAGLLELFAKSHELEDEIR